MNIGIFQRSVTFASLSAIAEGGRLFDSLLLPARLPATACTM